MSSTESDDSGSSGSEMESVWEGDGVAYSIFDDFQSPYAVEVYRHMASKFGFCHSILGKGTLHRIALVTYLEREKARGSDPLESYRRVCADPSIVLDHLDEYINPPFSNEKLIWDFLESSDEEDDEGVFQRHLHLERGTKTAKSQTKKCIQDDDYFKGYKNLAIHREMVNDRVRTGAYESFIRLNKSLFKDKVVLDVGSGCGILSLFAAKAGARLVVGIDNCDNMIKMSENHARINGIGNVQFLHGKVEDSDLVYSGGVVQFKRDDLPCEPFKCDILISEWMGYALLYENMLSSVLFARDRYLISGGLMVPSKVKLGLFAVDMYDDIKSKLNEWDERKYGLILDGLRYEAHELLKEPVVEVVDPSRIVSDASGICILDLGRLNVQDLGKAHEFQVAIHDGCKCSSLALYFDCIFEPVASDSANVIQSLKGKRFHTLESYREVLGIDELTSYVTSPDYPHPEEPMSTAVVMSTRADQPPTHWKQVILHLTDHNNMPVAIQGAIGGKLSLLNNSSNCRWLDILFQPDDTSLLGECYYKLM